MENRSPRRVSLRHVDHEGQAHDVVGELVLADDEQLVLLPHGRGPLRIPRSQVRAMKWAPPRMVRPTSRVDDVQRMLSRTWPGTEQVRMGGWLLRAGKGATRRANSVLTTGDPERDLDRSLSDVTGWYRERGLVPCVQTSARSWQSDEPGAVLDRELERRGWSASGHALVMVAPLPEPAVAPGDLRARWSDEPDATWQSLEPPTAAQLAEATAAPAQYVVLLDDRLPLARGRVAPSDDWVVLSGLVVRPDARRRGLGRAITREMLARAHHFGSGFAALQVEAGNQPAQSLYRGSGFLPHHEYRYRSLTSPV